MTTNFNETAKIAGGNGGDDKIRLYSSEILQLFAGKEIVSATPCGELMARNNKTYPGIVVSVKGIALKVGFLPWEIRCLTVQHYSSEDVSVPVAVDSALKDAVMASLLSCNGNEEAYYQSICDAIVGKFSGYHLSVGKNSKTDKLYPQFTWIVVDDAEKAIVDITKKEAE